MAYNPYDDLKQIYNSKVNYNKAKNVNDTVGMQNAADSAQPYYQNLRSNGYSKYADDMSGYTETQAWEMINSMNPSKPPVQISFGNANNWQNQPAQSVQVPQQTVTPTFTQPVAQPSANANGSIYQNITQDIIDAVQGITDNKTLYDNSKFTLQDGNYQQYAELAIPYYDSLRAAGRSDIADYLSGSTTPAALEYLRSIGIELDPAQQDMNTTFNNLINQPSQGQNVGELWEQSKPIADYIMQSGQSASNTMTQGILNQLLSQPQQSLDMGQMWQDSKPIIDYINQTAQSGQSNPQEIYNTFKELLGTSSPSLDAEKMWEQSKPMIDYIMQSGNSDSQKIYDTFNSLINNASPSLDVNEMWEQSKPVIDYITQLTKPDETTQAANRQAVDNMNALFGQIMGNNQQIQQDSGKLNDLISQYMGEQSARYDDLYDWLKNTNYYDTDTAKNIMSYYNAQGGKAANGATADGMAQNSGNIDSYAAANALRQQLDFTNAGNQAVLNQYNAQAGNMLNTLKALGVDVGDAQDRMLGLLGSNQSYNADLLGKYNTGTNDALNYVNQSSQAGNAAAVDTLKALMGLYESGMTNDANKYLGQLEATSNMYNSSAANDTNRYLGQLGSIDSILKLYESGMTNDANKYLGQLQATGDLYKAGLNDNTNRYLGQMDSLKALLDFASSGMANDTNRFLGQLETAGGLTESGMVNDTNRYLGQLGALQSLLGLTESNMTNDTNRYLGQLGAAGDILANRDTLESTERQLSAANANNLEMLNAELASNERISTNELAQAMELAGINRELTLAELENAYKIASEGNVSNERISTNELAQAMELAGINRELTLAELENAYKIASEGNVSNERISANELAAALRQVEINAEVDKYVAGVNSSTDKYVADAQAAADRYAADTKAKADSTGNAVLGTGDYTYDALLYTFGQLRPTIAESNTGATSDDVDEMTWNAIGKELGFTDAQIKQLVQYYRNAKYDKDGNLISYGPQGEAPIPIIDDTFVSP